MFGFSDFDDDPVIDEKYKKDLNQKLNILEKEHMLRVVQTWFDERVSNFWSRYLNNTETVCINKYDKNLYTLIYQKD